jgi:SAM-dependent methyltransferase
MKNRYALELDQNCLRAGWGKHARLNNCPVCAANAVVEFVLGSTKLLHCRACDAVYNASPPSVEELKIYYEEEYVIESSAADAAAVEHRRLFRLPEQIKLTADIAKLMPAPALVLDIGCERGFFLDEIRRFGYKVKGVEPSSAAREYCTRIGIDAVASLNQTDELFDVIVMWHSLEHFPNPMQTMRDIRCRLADGGVLLVRVPAFDSKPRKILGQHWIWFQPKNHYFHYSETSLRKLFELNGLDVVQLRSQRPNDRLTSMSYRLSTAVYGRYSKFHPTLRKRLAQVYQKITGVELYAIGKKH